MRYIEIELVKEKEKLEKKLIEVKQRVKSAPKGRIYVNKKASHVEYYFKKDTKRNKSNEKLDEDNKKNGKYIKKEHLYIARQIAQRDYDSSFIKNVEERIRAIDTFLRRYEKTNISKIYEKTNEYRRILLEDAVLSDEEYVRRWESVEYEGKVFLDDVKEIYTNRGERVRSKSEKIIADRLEVLGVPYRYEYPLVLKDNTKIYPDFTLLNIDTKEEIYLEHCGLMDDQEYVGNLIYKLKTYERNGIYLGVNLFITYETNRFPLNCKMLDELINHLFCCTKHISLVK